MMFEVEFREEIGKAIPRIVECLKDSDEDVRSAAVEALSLLGAYCMCPSVSPLLLSLNNV
jgi:HEAT repeat protein